MDIKTLRTNLMLSQEEFARLIDVTNVSISNWEKGTKTPQPKNLRKIAEIEKQYNEGNFKYEKI